jgi:hypothetical protein
MDGTFSNESSQIKFMNSLKEYVEKWIRIIIIVSNWTDFFIIIRSVTLFCNKIKQLFFIVKLKLIHRTK